MLPLFDMMLQAQNGMAMDAMAKQYGLAHEQAAKAVAALMPAFASGFKRNTTNPYDFSALVQAMTSGNYAKYFEDMSSAFTPQGIADGNQVLQQLFGSKEVSRAVAAQAAQLTGIGQDILKQMMPAMADTLMGGLFKQTTGQFPGANAFAGTQMAAMMQQWLESTGLQPKPQPQQAAMAAAMFDNPFMRAFQEMMGGQKKPEPQAASNPFLDNPFTKAFQDMATAYTAQMTGQPAEAPKASPEPAKTPEKEAQEGFAAMMNTMFDSGLEVQKSYQKSMEQIFDTYLTASRKDETAAPQPKG